MPTEPETRRAKPVFAEKLPTPIPRLGKISKALTTLYGAGCIMEQTGTYLVFFTAGEPCHCQRCTDDKHRVIGDDAFMFEGMIICPHCGNKRCPHATDHDFDCTGSNEPGQIGSSYL